MFPAPQVATRLTVKTTVTPVSPCDKQAPAVPVSGFLRARAARPADVSMMLR
jgi:hypothetical protein